ncbi:MAG: single-stranded-DNA-specific exonuclease RecJ, partial [bacterium]|nr:single-stranded-DNA-specific exonuclease RecJ [bacterium]
MDITFLSELKSDNKLTPAEIVEMILKKRGIKDEEFMTPVHPLKINIEEMGFKKEVKKTLLLLEKIKKEGRTIVVYTDYDADGITGGSIVWETLHLLGFHVMPYVPHRKLEGYGFSEKGINAVKKQFDPALIISVDHGISAREKIVYATSLHIPIIITDHHLKPEKIPDAEVIFHIPELSGSGVGYFFAKMIYEFFQKDTTSEKKELLKHNFSNDYLALASIGTVADLVPLLGPSRSIVKYGLEAFPHARRHGLKCIIEEAGIKDKKITPYEIGFIIAPRINAVGRLEHAIDALRLLCTTNGTKAKELASKVGATNRERQDMVKTSVAEARQMVEKMKKKDNLPKLIILRHDEWHEGIIGLIASKILEEHYRPVIVMTKSDGFLKGSARSIVSFHMTDFLRSLKKYLIDAGGHAQAAGFTIYKEQVEEFTEKAVKKAERMISQKDLIKTLQADMKMPMFKATLTLAEKIEELQPFGMGNPQPIFYSEAEVVGTKLFGKKSEYLKIFVKD